MWNMINQALFLLELALILVGILFIFPKKSSFKTLVFICFIFVLNFAIYLLPALYDKIALGKDVNFFFHILDCIPASTKALVGDAKTGLVEGYISIFPRFIYIYAIALFIGLFSTSFAAINAFWNKLSNAFNLARVLSTKSCDIISNSCSEALSYAKNYKNTVLLLSGDTDKSYIDSLISNHYIVLSSKFSKHFLSHKRFNNSTRYNIILPSGDYQGFMEEIFSYFNSGKSKNFYFYVEVDEKAIATIKKQIDSSAKDYRERITLFSKTELLARAFTEKYSMSRDIPGECFDIDTSLKGDTSLNVFMLGFTSLSRNIYKEFLINNQFTVFENGEYKAHPINYYLYDKDVDEKIWEINGLSDTLSALYENKEEYFPLPTMPYNTKCIPDSTYEFDSIKEIAEKISDSTFSYIIIDSGDAYKNIEIAERFNLLLDKCDNFKIFAYNNSSLPEFANLTYYGNAESIFNHDIIVNESLLALAKSVNKFYGGTDNFSTLSYFDMGSNISLANSLRFKLNLLGLDYEKGEIANIDLIENLLEKSEDYLSQNKQNALLSAEHLRWNAYHLLSGFLPMKKARISVEKDGEKIKKVTKNVTLKKHACLTTYNGLSELSEFLKDKANEITGGNYTSKDFDFYKYDDLLLRAIPDFMKENGYSLIKK